MSPTEPVRALSDEARFELAMAAAGRARRNRPTLLVVVSALVFMAALLAAIWGFSARAAARSAYVRELGEQADVERLNVEWERLTQQERESGGDTGASKPRELIYSRMQELARRAGMKESSMTPRANPTTRGQYTVTEYVYQDIKDPELKALMQWMVLATSEIPGLEVYGVVLTPETNNWNLTVTFRRVEKPGT